MANEEKLLPKNASPERVPSEVMKVAGERLKQIENSPEKKGEREPSQQERLEHARRQAEIEAVFSKEASHEQKAASEPEPDTRPSPNISKKKKEAEYEKTLASVRSNLSKPSRAFSKVIHQNSVEKVSNAVGGSIARPNAILAGSFVAFVAVLGVYVLAGYNGFRLSGFETIAAFAVGWVVGVLIDILRVAFLRRRA